MASLWVLASWWEPVGGGLLGRPTNPLFFEVEHRLYSKAQSPLFLCRIHPSLMINVSWNFEKLTRSIEDGTYFHFKIVCSTRYKYYGDDRIQELSQGRPVRTTPRPRRPVASQWVLASRGEPEGGGSLGKTLNPPLLWSWTATLF
jgi:hypothetical protein